MCKTESRRLAAIARKLRQNAGKLRDIEGMDKEIEEQLIEAGVDVKSVLERFMNNEALFLKFIKKFPEGREFEQMVTAIEAGKSEEAFKAAHTLKGVTGNLSMNSLYEIMIHMTEKLRVQQTEGLMEDLEKAKSAYAKVTEVIKKL